MRVVADRAAAPDPAPYTEAEATFAQTTAYLSSREARQMSESDLERELQRRGQELIRKLLQGHLDQRSPGEAAGPVAGADGVERAERRVHERHLETTFGTVQVERVGYARSGHDSLHPLDASLNLPPERYSLEVRRRVAEAAASRSSDEALFERSRHTGAEVPKRQAEQLWLARRRISTTSTRRAARRRASRRRRGRWWCSRSTARAWCCIARTCARRRARRPRGAGGNGSRSPGSSASGRERRSTRSAWRRWPPSTRLRRSCGARRSSCRA